MLYERTKTILREQGLAAHKKLGQNFLVHRHTAERIAELAGVAKEDTILEVGVGLGALTRPLAGRATKVIGIEADSGIIKWHQEQKELPDNCPRCRRRHDRCKKYRSKKGNPPHLSMKQHRKPKRQGNAARDQTRRKNQTIDHCFIEERICRKHLSIVLNTYK